MPATVSNDAELVLTLIPFVIIASVAFFIWQYRREMAKRAARAARRCIVCGYDLRSSPEVCPECGMPVGHSLAPEPLNLARLNTDWPAAAIAPEPPPRGTRMALLHTAATAQQADLLANQLKARGVWAEIRPGPDVALVLVPHADADRAAAIVAQFRFRSRGTQS